MRYMFLWKSLVSQFGVFEFVLNTTKLDCTKYFDNVGCLLKISLLTLINCIMAEKLRHFWRFLKEKMKWRQAAPPNGLILGGRIGCAASSRRLQSVGKKCPPSAKTGSRRRSKIFYKWRGGGLAFLALAAFFFWMRRIFLAAISAHAARLLGSNSG